MTPDEACRVASREKIAAWCRDGRVASRVGLRVSRIRDLDTGMNDTISDEDLLLDPANWASNALGNLHGSHWWGGEARFEVDQAQGLPFGLNMTLLGGAFYQIQIHRGDLKRMLEVALPKAQIGRPAGGGYLKSDRAIVEKMLAALANSDFTSPTAAAKHFAIQAEGGGTIEAKAKRLVRLFKKSERAAGS